MNMLISAIDSGLTFGFANRCYDRQTSIGEVSRSQAFMCFGRQTAKEGLSTRD